MNRHVKHLVGRWSITLAFLIFVAANVTAFAVIDHHHDEVVEWQKDYCTSLQSGRHELRVLVGKLEEATSNPLVGEELKEFLTLYPEIEC